MINEIQEAFYGRISALSGISAYNHVPQDEVDYPFVVVDSITLENNDSDSEFAYIGMAYVHVWSDYKGEFEAAGIQKQIYDACHRQPLTTTSYKISGIHQEFSEILVDPDGITRHGVQRYKIYFEPNNPPS